MVAPETFFSTLVQATAASIGFLLAFIAVLYSTRKSQTSNRKFRLIDHLKDVEEEFDPLLESIEEQLRAVGDFPATNSRIEKMKEIEIDQDELEELAGHFDHPRAVKLYANVVRTQKILNLIVTPQPNEKKSTYLSLLNFTTTDMADSVYYAKTALSLVVEFSGDTESDPDELMSESILPAKPAIDTWLDRNHIDESSESLMSWQQVLQDLTHKTRRGGALAQGSDLVVDFTEYRYVIRRVGQLFFIGVIFPMLFLFIEFPAWWPRLTGMWMTGVQVALLAVIAYLVYGLIGSVAQLIDLESKIG